MEVDGLAFSDEAFAVASDATSGYNKVVRFDVEVRTRTAVDFEEETYSFLDI